MKAHELRLSFGISKLFILALLIFTTSVAMAQMQQGRALVRSVRGTVQVQEGARNWGNLKVGAILKSGVTLKTPAESKVDLFMAANGPVIRVLEHTILAFDDLAYIQQNEALAVTTVLDLKQGSILGHVKKLTPQSSYVVKTPAVTCDIRGTTYLINGTGEVAVGDGMIQVTYMSPGNGQKVRVEVRAGMKFTPPVQGQKQHTLEPLAENAPEKKAMLELLAAQSQLAASVEG